MASHPATMPAPDAPPPFRGAVAVAVLLAACAPDTADTGCAAPACPPILAACPHADARADAEIGGCGVVEAAITTDDGAQLALPVLVGAGWVEWGCPASGEVVILLGRGR